MNWNLNPVLQQFLAIPTEPSGETEMCDVCCRNYPHPQITRIKYCNPRGTCYVIRCCPYCNPQALIPYLQ